MKSQPTSSTDEIEESDEDLEERHFFILTSDPEIICFQCIPMFQFGRITTSAVISPYFLWVFQVASAASQSVHYFNCTVCSEWQPHLLPSIDANFASCPLQNWKTRWVVQLEYFFIFLCFGENNYTILKHIIQLSRTHSCLAAYSCFSRLVKCWATTTENKWILIWPNVSSYNVFSCIG